MNYATLSKPTEILIAPSAAKPGVVGTYDVVASLGSGGMGDLLLTARRGADGFRRLCVIKRLRRTLAIDASFREMFVREGRIASRMNHPNVVSTLAVGEHGTSLFVAMEYLEGQTLQALVAAMGQASYSADPLLSVRVISDVLAGLQCAHELRGERGESLGVIHGDLNPHNVFVTYEGRVVLLDFASARLNAEASRVDRVTVRGHVGYAAPEQIAGLPPDRRADVFSAGIVLWELLAEKRLTRDRNSHPAIQVRVPHLSTVKPEIDPRLAAIVAKAVEIDPASRYATADAMRDALERYADAAGRMVRRGELTSVMAVMFDEERRRFEEGVRERLSMLDVTEVEEPEPSRARPKPRLELVDSGEELAGGTHSIDDISMLSATDLKSIRDAELRSTKSSDCGDDEPSSNDVVGAEGCVDEAVSVPEGPDTLRSTAGQLRDALHEPPTRVSATPATRAVFEAETATAHACSSVGIPAAWTAEAAASIEDIPISVAPM